jgi:hypothetical protein
VSEITLEKWQQVLKSYPNSNSTGLRIFIFNETQDLKKHGKVFGKQALTETKNKHFAVISETPEDGLKLFEIQTCFEKISDLKSIDNYFMWGTEKTWLFIIMIPQLTSVICFVILLSFYATIDELKNNVHGTCWIHFLGNSLANYLSAIYLLLYNIFEVKTDHLVLFILVLVAMPVLGFTEFSLYFWMNVTFFETFYVFR